MSIDVRPICDADGKDCQIQMSQTVDMVVDIERTLRRKDSPVPKPQDAGQLTCDSSKDYASHDVCLPLDGSSNAQWSLSSLFGRPIHGYCPLAVHDGVEPAHVCIQTSKDRQISFSGSQEQVVSDEERCYILQAGNDFDLSLPNQEPPVSPSRAEPLLYAERSFTGHGQERGGVQAILQNPSTSQSVEIIYLESLPWFMKPYLHTFNAKRVGGGSDDEKIIQEVYYRPALDRKRGTQLEARMIVPSNSSVLVTYDFEKAILRYTEYPPDANRGFDVA